MASTPLFIHSPVSESVMQALPFINENRVFSFHTLRVDPDLFPLLLDARPCVAIFSIPSPEQTRAVCSLLESFRLYRTAQGYSQRDPTLRIILVAEERAVAIERWHELGVHEFIIAPILPRALAFKVARHQQRASSSPIPEPVHESYETDDSVVVIRSNETAESPKPEYRIIHTQFTPVFDETSEVRFRPSAGDRRAPRKISVFASIPELNEEEGEWRPASPQESGDSGGDKAWSWSWFPPKDREMKQRWIHHGDRPSYDKKRAGWKLSGVRPELTLQDEKGASRKLLSVTEEKLGSEALPEVVADEQLDVQEVTGDIVTPQKDSPQAPIRHSQETSSAVLHPWKRHDSSSSGREAPRIRNRIEPEESESSRERASLADSSESGTEPTEPVQQEIDKPNELEPAQEFTEDELREFFSEAETETQAPPEELTGELRNAEDEARTPELPKLSEKERRSLGARIKRIILKELPGKDDEEDEDENEKYETDGGDVEQESDTRERERPVKSADPELEAPTPADSEILLAESDGSVDTEAAERDVPVFEGKPGESPRVANQLTGSSASTESDWKHKSSQETDEKSGSALRPGGKRPFSPPERHLRLDPENRDSKDLKLSSSSNLNAPEGDLELKGSSGESNTWSMQNLDDPESFVHAKSKRKDLPEVLSPRIPESDEASATAEVAAGAADPISKMSPEERARLLKKVYENLQIGAAKTAEPEPEASLFAKFLKRVRAYLGLGED